MNPVSPPRSALTVAAGLTITAVCLAVGCTASGSATAPGASPWPAQAAGTTTVTILSGTDTSVSAGNKPVHADESGMYSQLVDWWNAYEQPRTHIAVALETIPGGATAEHSEMLSDAETGDADYDIYNLDNEWVPEFAAANFIRSLRGGHLQERDFLPQPFASGSYGGQLYAAPFTTDVGLLYYRKDLVSKTQVNALRSFSALLKLAEQRTTSEGTTPMVGYAGQFADYEGLTVNVLEIIHSYDPNAFTLDGEIGNENAVIQGLQQLYDAMFVFSVIPPAERNYTEAQAFTAFATGKALFMRNWPIDFELLASASVRGSSQVASHFAVAPLPFPSVLGGQDLAISAKSRHPTAALRVIKYLTSPQAEQCLFAVGGFPATRPSAYAQGTALPTGYGGITGHPLCGTVPGPSPEIGQTILAGIAKAFQRPRTPYYTEFTAIMQDLVPQLLNGEPDLNDLVHALGSGLRAAASGLPPA